MKAIMIVVLPDNINVDLMCKTPVSLTFEHKSYKTILYADGYLKPMPDKIDQGYPCDTYEEGYGDGRNECIDEILGDQNDIL